MNALTLALRGEVFEPKPPARPPIAPVSWRLPAYIRYRFFWKKFLTLLS
jgi:hypothetical protein